MKIAFVNYNDIPKEYTPQAWINKIRPYFGVLELLSHQHEIYYISAFSQSCEYHHEKVCCYFKASSNRLSSLIRINSQVQKTAPDLVVVYGLHFPFAVSLLRKIPGKKTKIILQSHADKPFTGWRKYFQQRAYHSINYSFFSSLELAKPFVENGIFTSEQIKEILPASSFFVPLEKELALSRTCVKGDPVFVWVGRLDQNKDPLLVVECFLHWVKKNPSASLYMIYQTVELMNELKILLKNYPCWTKNIVLIGKIPHDELLYWFCSADFYISASHAESYGLSLCEAMSCGTIPIVTNIPSFRKMTGNGSCGILYEAGNKTSLMNALNSTILIDRKRESDITLNYFQENISFNSIVKQFEELLA